MKEQTYAYADEVSQYARNASARFSTRQLRFAFAGAAFVVLFLFMFGGGVGGHAMAAFGVTTATSSSFALAMQETGPWKKPTGFKIIGLVFCEFLSYMWLHKVELLMISIQTEGHFSLTFSIAIF